MLTLEKRLAPSRAMALLSPVLALALSLFSGAMLFQALGQPPLEALYTFFISPLVDVYGWTELAVKVTPVLLCAIGLAVSYRAKVWNIGAEGQLTMGALAGGYAALIGADQHTHWLLLWVILAGVLGGTLWAGLAAWLKTAFGANEILTTIMLNYIAINLLLFAVHGPLKDPNGYNFPESALFSEYALMPNLLADYRLNLAFILALILLILGSIMLRKTLLGFQIRVLGEDEAAARYAGFSQRKLTWLVLLISGALAGLAGVSEVTGPIGQLVASVSPGYGYTAIIVVFLGRMQAVGMLLASLLMGLTFLGGEMLQMEHNLPRSIASLFQGMLLFYLLACDLLIHYRIRPAANLSLASFFTPKLHKAREK